MQNKQKQDRDLFKCFKKLIKSACDYGQSILKQICGTCVIQDDKSNDKPFNVETDIESTKTSNKTTQKRKKITKKKPIKKSSAKK